MRRRLSQLFLTFILAAMGAMWIYAWVFAPRGDPDRLVDQDWTEEALARCTLTREAIGTVQPGVADPSQRANDVDVITDVLDAMVRDLRDDLPADVDDADSVGRWLDDYAIYLVDRREFADTLRSDPNARFLVTSRDGRQLTAVLDRFADTNGMQACMTPGDVA